MTRGTKLAAGEPRATKTRRSWSGGTTTRMGAGFESLDTSQRAGIAQRLVRWMK